jgi:hypothetical protein
VTKHDLWQEVGGKLDFVQFPATANTPARSGPGHAQTLEHIYRQYLYQFERMFVEGIQRKRAQAAGPTQPSPVPSPRDLSQVPPQQILKLVPFANISAERLRAQPIPENVVQLIERNRPYLLALASGRVPPPTAGQMPPAPAQPPTGPPGGMGPQHARAPSAGMAMGPGPSMDPALGMATASNPFGANPAISQQELTALGQQYLSDRQRMYHARGRSRLTASDGRCADILSRLCSPA